MMPLFGGLTSMVATLIVSIAGLVVVFYLSKLVLKSSPGTELMQKISALIHTGATAFLRSEFKTISIFAVFMIIVIIVGIDFKTAIAFVLGAICSLLSGYLGIGIATRANTRTAEAARKSFVDALKVAYQGGSVMGISVVSLGLLGLSVIFLTYLNFMSPQEVVKYIIGFSFGASSVALFMRVGGGIYTKAADVGADLVGKVEIGIPEDDPRNPAVIADNVGDNVGDVTGMGADLFESYVGAIISAFIITAAAIVFEMKNIMLPLLISSWGLISSVLGIYFIRAKKEEDPQITLNKAMISSIVFFIIGCLIIGSVWYADIKVFFATLCGLTAGVLVGFVAQYFTSGKVVRELAHSAQTGTGTLIIHGLAIGMASTILPIISIAIATVLAYKLAGVYGIALSAIGMLALTGTTVTIDAYGPIADNAAGISEMARLGNEARKRTERLDAVGNTTAAVGKGFAIGSAALTALALFAAYSATSGVEMLDLLNPKVVSGLFIGAILPFIFCSRTMLAVGKTAFKIVEEVRRQFKEIPGLLEGKAYPDSAKCVSITTQAALKEMILPGLIAIIAPFVLGCILGLESLGGFLAGSLATGVPLAIFLANVGGAWDNAKKYVEEGNLGGKGSNIHKSTVIGDTVGDPCKDTAGPSLNILLKLMAIVSIVFSPLILKINNSIIAIFPLLK